MTSNVWHRFCTYRTKEHERRCLLHFSIIMSHSILSGATFVESKTKSIRPRRRPRSVDRGLRLQDWSWLRFYKVV